MRKTKPIRVFFSELTNRFYASRSYKQEGDIFVITGQKYDVTNDIGSIVTRFEIEFHQRESSAEIKIVK